jgi:predicted small integral membrane protein
MDPMIMGICRASRSGMVIAEDFIAVICIFGRIVDINQFFVFQIMFI